MTTKQITLQVVVTIHESVDILKKENRLHLENSAAYLLTQGEFQDVVSVQLIYDSELVSTKFLVLNRATEYASTLFETEREAIAYVEDEVLSNDVNISDLEVLEVVSVKKPVIKLEEV